MTTPQQHANDQLVLWQLRARMGIKPESRKLIEQDNEPSFYDLQLRLISEQMDAR
jgi:hypothetical protein